MTWSNPVPWVDDFPVLFCVVVAAADSSLADKAAADLVCDGDISDVITLRHAVLQAAQDTGRVMLLPGCYRAPQPKWDGTTIIKRGVVFAP